jgi:hypothetical protein
MQGIYDVDMHADGTRAKSRFPQHDERGHLPEYQELTSKRFSPVVRRRYVRERVHQEAGVWKTICLKYVPFWHAKFDKGWSRTKPFCKTFRSLIYPEDSNSPVELCQDPMLWPDTRIVVYLFTLHALLQMSRWLTTTCEHQHTVQARRR